MKIGIIAAELPPAHGGMQEHAVGLIRHLSRRHEVTVFTLEGRFVDVPDVQIVDALTDVLPKDVATLQQHKTDVWIALSAGAACFAPHLKGPFFSYVHGNDFLKPWAPFPSTRIAEISRRVNRLPVLGRLCSFALANWRRQRMAEGLHRSALIFANSRFTRQRCCEVFSLDATRVVVVAPGIDDVHFQGRVQARKREATEPLRILTVSRLTKATRRKNVEAVIRAVALLAPELDVRYSIVGGGDDLPRHQKLAEGLGVSERVTFAGAVDSVKLQEFYVSADVFVLAALPSTTDVEGFGMVYVEAAAHGVPVIAVDSGGVADAVKPEMGLLIRSGGPEDVASALREVNRRRAEFAPDSIREAAASFSAESTSRQLLSCVEKMVG